MQELSYILEHIDYFNLYGKTDKQIAQIVFDSRKTVQGALFVAVKGTQTDGHTYINEAIEMGASAIICEDMPKELNNELCYIQVVDSAMALSHAAAAFYNFPSHELKLIGVTGTNGKTSIATLLYELTTELGFASGLLSTIANKINGKEIPSTHTTPDAVAINVLLSEMVKQNCEYAFMEVSSHAIDQKRIAGLEFTGAIFTNLTHDHLDYHKTFANYRDVKKKFFDNLSKRAFALVNADDKNARFMLQNTKAQKYSYALQNIADFNAKVLEYDLRGTYMIIDQREAWMQFVGKFNASNLLAVYATSVLLGHEKDEILRVMSALRPVEGRFDTLLCCGNKNVVIDYAHTPDALENVLKTIAGVREKSAEIFTVFGAGGNRDKSKRPEMAEAVARYSNKIIITSDNPRNENPEEIINDIYIGVPLAKRNAVLKISDRKQAIRTALMMAKEGDVILIAGKGHEKYQEINGQKFPFDDKKVVLEYNEELKA